MMFGLAQLAITREGAARRVRQATNQKEIGQLALIISLLLQLSN